MDFCKHNSETSNSRPIKSKCYSSPYINLTQKTVIREFEFQGTANYIHKQVVKFCIGSRNLPNISEKLKETYFSSSFLSSSSLAARIESNKLWSKSSTEEAVRVSYKGAIPKKNHQRNIRNIKSQANSHWLEKASYFTIRFDEIQDLILELDFLDVWDIGMSEKEELVG